jgi:hypothetical protein
MDRCEHFDEYIMHLRSGEAGFRHRFIDALKLLHGLDLRLRAPGEIFGLRRAHIAEEA